MSWICICTCHVYASVMHSRAYLVLKARSNKAIVLMHTCMHMCAKYYRGLDCQQANEVHPSIYNNPAFVLMLHNDPRGKHRPTKYYAAVHGIYISSTSCFRSDPHDKHHQHATICGVYIFIPLMLYERVNTTSIVQSMQHAIFPANHIHHLCLVPTRLGKTLAKHWRDLCQHSTDMSFTTDRTHCCWAPTRQKRHFRSS